MNAFLIIKLLVLTIVALAGLIAFTKFLKHTNRARTPINDIKLRGMLNTLSKDNLVRLSASLLKTSFDNEDELEIIGKILAEG